MLLDDDFEELLLVEDLLELADERLDELAALLDEETLMLDAVLDEVLDTDTALLDDELGTLLVALLTLEEDALTTLLEEELDGCDEVSDGLLLMFPVALEELTAPEPPVHAAVNAEAINTHAIPYARRSRMFMTSTTLTVQ